MLHFIYYRENDGTTVNALQENTLDFYELTICIKGTLEYFNNDEPITLHDGDAIILRPYTKRRRNLVRDTSYVSFNFSSTEIINLPQTLHNTLTQPIQQLLMLARNVIPMRQLEYNDERYEAILDCILKELKHQLFKVEEKPIIVSIKQYIEKHIGEKITLDDIQNYTFFSKVYCDILFKKETGQSITDYILSRRIKTAQLLMFENNYSLSEIASNVGFTDMNYFSRTFKKRVGISPSKYIKMNFTNEKK